MSIYIDSNDNNSAVSEASIPVNQSINQSIVRARGGNAEPLFNWTRSTSQSGQGNGYSIHDTPMSPDDNHKHHRPTNHTSSIRKTINSIVQSINPPSNQWKKWRILVAMILTFVVLIQIISFNHHDHIELRDQSAYPDWLKQSNLHSTFESTHSLGLHYHAIVTNLLPYASDEQDSAGQSLTLRGLYGDQSKFIYPICTFTKICASQSFVNLAFHNYTVWSFYNTVLPHCTGKLYRRFELCGCFHSNYQPRLMPYPYRITALDRLQANEFVPRLIESRWPGLGIELNKTYSNPLSDQREMPSVEELSSTVDRSNDKSSNQRWYADPFTTEPVPGPPAAGEPQPDKFTFHHYAAHYWSVNKWVRVHHIAHWAQKLLTLQASYGHYAHACRHTYRRVQRSEYIEGVDYYKNGPYVNENGQREVEWYIDLQETTRDHDNFTSLTMSDDLYMLDCLPAIEGVMFHDSYAPLSEHELSFLNISFAALQTSVDQVGDNILLHRPRKYDTSREQYVALHPRDEPFHSAESLYTPPALDPSFSLAKHVLFSQDLFQQFTSEYLENVDSWNKLLPAPVAVNAMACFDRLSFSPLFGTFGDNPYDLDPWKQATSVYFGITTHREHKYRPIHIPPFDDPQTRFLGGMLDARVARLESRHLMSLPRPKIYNTSATRRDSDVPIEAGPIHEMAAAALRLSSCPPPRAVLIHRPDRSILNSGELVRMMRDKYNFEIAIASVDERTSSAEQAKLFADAGLVLAAHSSQMVNVLFSHPGSAMIEVTGEFYNIDFARYATSMGIYFRYAFGGRFTNPYDPPDQLMTDCVGNLTQCDGDSFCVGKRSYLYCKQFNFFPNKNSPFYANLTAVDIAVRQALGHVLHSCNGLWGNAQLTKLTTDP